MLTKSADREKSLAGYWRLPALSDMDECVTLLPNKMLEWTVTPTSSLRTLGTIVTGERMTGTWSVRAKRPTPALDMFRRGMRSSSGSIGGSSARLIPESLRRIANYNPETGGYLPDIGSRRPAPSATIAYPPAESWLILKITNFPQSLLNLNIMGTRIDIVDWIHNLKEIFADHAYAILASDDESMKLRTPNGKIVTWERVNRFFPEMANNPS